ncbi:hypothetical protein D1AOALGA4SA_2608 [Olavius algarvensis Delta 1 endosymbiont]|nr:hypothetical protein D1AOALGA4SA_2608 [Olavius algarvensis Delta 1 endosymbiont]
MDCGLRVADWRYRFALSNFNPQITQITQITKHVVEIAKPSGFNSPQLAAFGNKYHALIIRGLPR